LPRTYPTGPGRDHPSRNPRLLTAHSPADRRSDRGDPTPSPPATVAGHPVTVDRVRLVAAAVCPHPPMLVPQLAAGAAAELDALRAAAESAVRGRLRAGADGLVTVGGGPRTFTVESVEFTSTARYGSPDQSRFGAGGG